MGMCIDPFMHGINFHPDAVYMSDQLGIAKLIVQ